MAFLPIQQSRRSFTRVVAPRFAIVNTPTMRVGRVTLPKEIIKKLTWAPQINIEVLKGDGDDTGWYALKPMLTQGPMRHRAQLKVNGANGVGRYSTKALAPPNTTGPVNTFEPVYRVEGNALYLKLLE